MLLGAVRHKGFVFVLVRICLCFSEDLCRLYHTLSTIVLIGMWPPFGGMQIFWFLVVLNVIPCNFSMLRRSLVRLLFFFVQNGNFSSRNDLWDQYSFWSCYSLMCAI